ncbi:MAG: BamA/TamA family outer membrane protein, partial [candidate division Zixibacteria bacterium]|nr:BamA/TamA family outer membrane protein [candidate division Zixibacteria bacterium]
PTAQISAGAGYSGQDKLVGNFGLGIPNFRGMGQNLSFSIDVGSSFNSYSLSFTEPWLFSTPTSLGTNIYSTNRRWYTDYTEGRRGGSVQLGKRLKWPDNYFRFYTMYRLEKNRLYDFSDSYLESHSDIDTLKYYMSGTEKIIGAIIRGRPISGSLLAYQKQWLTASSMQISIVRDSRDLPEFATSGSIISYAIENNGNFLGGYWNYQKHSLEISKYIPLFWKFVLAGKITYGAIATSAGDNRILESDRFSPGGTGYDGSVRGYDDGVLTPDSLTSDIITHVRYTDSTLSHSDSSFADTLYSEVRVHGKFMLIGNLELQMPIVENQIYALLFFDAGNSWLRASDMKLKDLYKGIGFGVRLVVPPIGTIGFDFGYRLDERKGEKQGWRLHPQFGTTIR